MFRRPACCWMLVTLLLPLCALGQGTDEGDEQQQLDNSFQVFSGSADSVLSQLSYVRFDRAAITRFDPFTLLQDGMRRLNNAMDRAARLRIGFAWTALYQHGQPARGPTDAASADFDFFGRWRPLETRDTLGYVIFQTEARYKLGTEITPSQLSESIGSLWGTTNAYNENSFHLKQLFWQQFLFRNTLTYRVGKLDLSQTFNVNRLGSDNFFFLNEAITDNPTIAYPDNGFAVDVTWRPDPLYYLAVGITNGDEGELNPDPNKRLNDISWYTVGEFGLTPWIRGVGGGHYRFTFWRSRADPSAQVSGSTGFSLSCDQDLGPKFMGFLRYGITDGNLTATKQVLSGGFGLKSPITDNADFAGVGLAWGEPSDGTLRDQWAVEGFYRLQLTPAIQVTPDLQLIFEPSNASNERLVWVFGIRVRINI